MFFMQIILSICFKFHLLCFIHGASMAHLLFFSSYYAYYDHYAPKKQGKFLVCENLLCNKLTSDSDSSASVGQFSLKQKRRNQQQSVIVNGRSENL